jgi:hypothetical protein
MQTQPTPNQESTTVESVGSDKVTILDDRCELENKAEALIPAANFDFDRPVSRYIWVTFQKEGIHRYPAAAEEPNLYDVRFLAFPHRHIFYFRVKIQVTHNDRDIEFIQFKRWLEALYGEGTLEVDHQSCEMLAENLMRVINNRYPGRELEVSVAEDNENGATLRLQ